MVGHHGCWCFAAVCVTKCFQLRRAASSIVLSHRVCMQQGSRSLAVCHHCPCPGSGRQPGCWRESPERYLPAARALIDSETVTQEKHAKTCTILEGNQSQTWIKSTTVMIHIIQCAEMIISPPCLVGQASFILLDIMRYLQDF